MKQTRNISICKIKVWVITAISSDSRPSKFEILDINNCFCHSSAVANPITSHIKIRQIRIRSTPIYFTQPRKHKMRYFSPKISRIMPYFEISEREKISECQKQLNSCQAFWVRWSRVTAVNKKYFDISNSVYMYLFMTFVTRTMHQMVQNYQ